jgi:hypothetical protein
MGSGRIVRQSIRAKMAPMLWSECLTFYANCDIVVCDSGSHITVLCTHSSYLVVITFLSGMNLMTLSVII